MQDQTSILITSPTRQRSRPITPLQLSATCICITCVLTAHVFHLLLWNQSSMYLSVHVQGVPMHVPLMFDYEPRETKAQMHYLEVARWWLRGIPRSTRWEHLSGRVKGSCTRGRRSGSACLRNRGGRRRRETSENRREEKNKKKKSAAWWGRGTSSGGERQAPPI